MARRKVVRRKRARRRAVRRRAAPRKHAVKVNLQVFELAKAGCSMEIEISAYGEKLGDLTIGRGSITWHGRNRKGAKRMRWTTFAQRMDELAYGD
jgi:hypothetical protein